MLRKDGPAGPLPFDLDAVMLYCRVDDEDRREEVESLCRAAIEFVSERTGLSLFRQNYVLEYGCWWGGCLEIPVYPVRDVTALKYLDADGVEQTVDAANYRWNRTDKGASIFLLAAFSQPTLQSERRDVVRVYVDGGFDVDGETGSGDDADLEMPERARQCVLRLTSHWYDNRGVIGDEKQIPAGVESLLGQLRIYR